ncbi:MAG: hypothetical protein FJ271_30315 [Planctomycetes bacterium]|nr:hypothetical protein [Planctomycetota bacterium]
MKVPFLLGVLVGASGLTFSSDLRAEIKVEPDKENVVASRLVGDWLLDAALTGRLARNAKVPAEAALVSFKSDPAVAAKLPAKYEKFLANRRVYLAGLMTLKGQKSRQHPFILIEHRGNPHIVWFRERDGDPLGDAESFNVMLAVARERQDDLLFIGGDFNNQPFRAFTRLKVEKKQ